MKYEILRIIRESDHGYVSGESLSKQLDVSRTAIWKYINELKSEGYNIEASTKKGYKLISLPSKLNSFEISYKLDTKIIGQTALCFDTLDSTNNYAKKLAQENAEDGTVVVADCQTEGKGRLGRTWDSPCDKGLYFSVILKPDMLPEDIQIVTIAASVAVVSAIENVLGIKAGIKWPNDIILDGKKVCGILTEMNSEIDKINYVVLGIGINILQNPTDLPYELKNKVISLSSYAKAIDLNLANFNKLDLIRSVLIELDRVYHFIINGKSPRIVNAWKGYSVTLNKNVRIVYRDAEYKGIAVDITKDGKLVIFCEDGVKREISSGEVSVRGLLGYL